jgi:hypothetical protein
LLPEEIARLDTAEDRDVLESMVRDESAIMRRLDMESQASKRSR